MQEVTRIHIAKVAYDIEVAAKKQLEKYLSSLQKYAHDDEVYADIEIRITELLAEHGVLAGGVVTADEVKAVRAQLGEPEDFADGDEAVLSVSEGRKKLYRNEDEAVVAGVLSGIGAYLGVDTVWVRLAFIALLFVSFGLALLAYVALWIVVPVAKTNSEKLAMRGEPVTLQSIRDMVGRDESGETSGRRRMRLLGKVLSIGVGVLALCMAVAAILATVFGGVTFLNLRSDLGGLNELEGFGVSLWLAAISMGLFALMCLFIAYMAFTRTIGRRVGIATLVVIVLGLSLAGTSAGLAIFTDQRNQQEVQSLMSKRSIAVEGDLSQAKVLDVSDLAANIRYEVSDNLRAEIDSMPWVKASVSVVDGVVKVALEQQDNEAREGLNVYRHSYEPRVTIYGPALDRVQANTSNVEYAASKQDNLAVNVADAGNVTTTGVFTNMMVSADEVGSFDGSGAAIDRVRVEVARSSKVTLGNIGELDVKHDTTCPAGSESTISLEGSRSGTMRLNGVEQPVVSVEMPCGKIEVGDDDNGLEV